MGSYRYNLDVIPCEKGAGKSRRHFVTRGRIALQILLAGVAFLYSPFVFSFPQGEPQVVIDQQSVDKATNDLLDELAGWVEAIRRQTPGTIHLVFAFSTGHFDDDPLAGDAARRIAAKFGGSILKEGDEFSVYGWEMDVWFRRKRLAPEKNIEQQILDECPVTPRQGSIDGHDTERAVVEIVRELGEPSNQLVLLLANHAQSVAPPKRPNYPLLGEDSPEYRKALESWQRLLRVRESGASFVLPYKVIWRDGGVKERSLDVVVVAPRGLQPVPPSPSPGSPVPKTPSPEPSEPRTPAWGGIVALFVALAVFGVVIWRWFQSSFGGTPIVEIEGEKVTLTGIKPGGQVCALVGEGYKSESVSEELRRIVLKGAPPVVLALLCRARDQKQGPVRLQGEGAVVEKVNNRLFSGKEVPLKYGEHKVDMKVRREGVGGVPEEASVEVTIIVRKEER
jgi:hypothetical protein